MRKLWKLAAGVVVAGLVAGPAGAAKVPFTGALTIEIGGAVQRVPGGGTATLNGSAGGALPISQLTIPAGVFTTVSLTFGPLPMATSFSHDTITAALGGTCTGTHVNVSCPGGGLAGFGGMDGLAGFGNLFVPLSVVGAGSTMTAAIPDSVTVSGAGWTTGVVTAGGATVATGSLMTTTLNSGSLTLVSPIAVRDVSTGELRTGFASITLHFVPEPGTLLLVSAGALGLALLGRRRARR